MELSLASLKTLIFEDDIKIITPNQRLSKFLLKQFLEKAKETNHSFNADKIVSIEGFLYQAFQHLQLSHPETYGKFCLLNPSQEKYQWEHIVKSSQISEKLLFKDVGVNKLINANQLLELWNIDLENIKNLHHRSVDQDAFEIWRNTFKDLCEENNWIIPAQLYGIIITAFNDKQLTTSEYYVFYGFDEINPAQNELMETISSLSKVERVEIPNSVCRYKYKVPMPSFEEELIAAALWSKKLQETFPDKTTAIVIPELNENRALIHSCFSKIINPDSFNLQNTKENTFNISSGIPLSETPLVNSALMLLDISSLLTNEVNVETSNILKLLINPFIFSNDLSINRRISTEQTLRNNLPLKVTLNQLCGFLEQYKNEPQSGMYTAFFSLYEKIETHKLKRKKSFSDWASIFTSILEDFNWIQDIQLDSENYQCCHKFLNCINSLSNIDHSHSKNNDMRDAFTNLRDICHQTLFQPESVNEDNNVINLLGVLEAAAQDFDHIWLCQMNDQLWPTAPSPNPYLSNSLQRQFEMPHSSPEKELRFSKQMIERFSHHCEHLVFSYATNDGDTTLNPSKLIDNVSIFDFNKLLAEFSVKHDDSKFIESEIRAKKEIEYFNDTENIPLPHGIHFSGGQSIIKNQGACPFRAFAFHRLEIQELVVPSEGLSALDRGNILHRLMELFWREIKNHKTLNDCGREKISSILSSFEKRISYEFKELDKLYPVAFGLELDRAKSIALNFLEKEKEREPFEVNSLEKKKKVLINGLELSLRADRIDTLENGDQLIIDYKSGNTSVSSWIPPRMDEPQLPLYLYKNKKVKAISFAQLSSEETDNIFAGIASRSSIADGIDSCSDTNKRRNRYFTGEWETFVSSWELDLENQALSFMDGVNHVDPKNIASSCNYCEFSSMCRIKEVV